jgi:two-component system, OmpR family, phosphate regulon sensor histidine kinase PhoR
VKKIFPVIIALITLSLIGIIVIQVSWIKNMLLVKEEQIKDKLEKVTTTVGEELAQVKGFYSSTPNRSYPGMQPDEFSFEFYKPVTVGQRFSTAEINEKLKTAFVNAKLDNSKYEFALATLNTRGMLGYIERQSNNFAKAYEDTLHNFSFVYALIPPSGTAAENLSPDEILIVVVHDIKNIVLKSMGWNISIAFLFSMIILSAFYLTVNTMLRQKKNSEIKNDFINNMTHEFKTPLATISLAVDALRNEKVINDREKMNYFSTIIKEENQRMNRQVETILRAALMDKNEVDMLLKPIHVHQVITEVMDNFSLQLDDKDGDAEISLNASDDLIEADEVHFSNLINNLIDNSVKYSKINVPPQLKISTTSNGKTISIRMTDNGIGMSKEALKRIFERFYRVHTGNLHNVKGFGLGLSYVKTMVTALGGNIKVESTLGKGSTFTIELPLKNKAVS